MKKLVINIEPFLLFQKAYSFTDNTIEEEIEIKTSQLDEMLFQLIEDNDINELSIAGAKQYSQKLKEKIQEKELAKYNTNKVEIKLI